MSSCALSPPSFDTARDHQFISQSSDHTKEYLTALADSGLGAVNSNFSVNHLLELEELPKPYCNMLSNTLTSVVQDNNNSKLPDLSAGMSPGYGDSLHHDRHTGRSRILSFQILSMLSRMYTQYTAKHTWIL